MNANVSKDDGLPSFGHGSEKNVKMGIKETIAKAGQIIKTTRLLTARQKSSLWGLAFCKAISSVTSAELSIILWAHAHPSTFKKAYHDRTWNIQPHNPNLAILRSGWKSGGSSITSGKILWKLPSPPFQEPTCSWMDRTMRILNRFDSTALCSSPRLQMFSKIPGFFSQWWAARADKRENRSITDFISHNFSWDVLMAWSQ